MALDFLINRASVNMDCDVCNINRITLKCSPKKLSFFFNGMTHLKMRIRIKGGKIQRQHQRGPDVNPEKAWHWGFGR